jgi:hypothetical protein
MRTSASEQATAEVDHENQMHSLIIYAHRFYSLFKSQLTGLFFCLLPALILTFPNPVQAQLSPKSINMRVGFSHANQIYKLYGSNDLKGSGDPVKGATISLAYNSVLSNKFILNSGLNYKSKGVWRNRYSRNSAAMAISPYRTDALSTSWKLMFFPYDHSNGVMYLGSGVGLDCMLAKKPKIHERFPYNVEVYFDQNDFRRVTMFASVCAGLMIFGDGAYIEFEYAPVITRNLNVRQLQIRDTFWSVSLVVYGRP